MLQPTGERLIEEYYQQTAEDYLIYLFHVVTYNFAKKFTQGNKVLDYGCGSGFGTAMLVGECESITGVDISSAAISYANSHYKAECLSYQVIEPAEKAPLPFDDGSFDCVLSFQVIEHILALDEYFTEVSRVLCPEGKFIVATPDRATRLLPFQKPWNIWHVKEYSVSSLQRLLNRNFCDVEILRMGGDQDVIQIELNRTTRAMWLTLPFTLPFVPDFVRIRFLKWLKRLRGRTATAKNSYKFDQSALHISSDAHPSFNIVAVARKRQA